MSSSPVVRNSVQGRTIAVVGDVYRVLATGDDTSGRYAQIEAIVPPGGGPPPHLHRREEEGFFILEGEITFRTGDVSIVAGVGMFVNMPIGVPHSFRNESERTARMLITVAPAGLEKMFLEVGAHLDEGSTTAHPPTDTEIQKLLAVAANYGVEILPPSA